MDGQTDGQNCNINTARQHCSVKCNYLSNYHLTVYNTSRLSVQLQEKHAAHKTLHQNSQWLSSTGTANTWMHVMNHNWSVTKQRLHPQSVAEISRHSALSEDRIRQCETSSGSRHKDTDQCL